MLQSSPSHGRLFAWGLPAAALGVSLLIVSPVWRQWQQQEGVLAAQRLEVQRLEAAPVPAPTESKLAVRNTPQEASLFLREMRALAQATRSEFVGLDVRARAPEGASTQDTGPVRAIRMQITLRSTYPRLRAFLARLAKAERLYSVTELSVRRRATTATDAPTLDATMVIERYVIAEAGSAGQ